MRAMIARALAAMIGVAAAGAASVSVEASERPRIASINMCTDQLLLAVADPEQIVGLSPFARDADRAFSAGAAAEHRTLSGSAEEILVLRPDIVMSGFTKPATAAILREQGFVLEEFTPVTSIAETRAQILRAGNLAGHPERARTHVEALDSALARIRSGAAAGLRILPLARRGWVSGEHSLISELVGLFGAKNAAAEFGLGAGGFMSLEAVIKLRPDALLLSEPEQRAEDQGSAMLMHPALRDLFPPERRLYLRESLTVCGGPMLVEALESLADQVEGLPPPRSASIAGSR
jgi:iron complex transport system substrate-binding protein